MLAIYLDPNSTLVSADLKSGDYLIDINQPMVIPNTQGFPIEAFFSVPFTHHIRIVQNVKNFIMTFGCDFAFIGNQYHLEVYAIDHYPDLLFFNRELNALVVIDLKKGDFKPSYLGQLAAYLRILDDKVRKPHENQTIGLILCKSAEKEYVEYIIQDYNKPIGVATYTTENDMPEKLRNALPPVKELKKLL